MGTAFTDTPNDADIPLDVFTEGTTTWTFYIDGTSGDLKVDIAGPNGPSLGIWFGATDVIWVGT